MNFAQGKKEERTNRLTARDGVCFLPIARRLESRVQAAGTGRPAEERSVDGIKIFFFGAALGTDPVIGQVGKGSSGLDIVFVVAFGGVINITAGAFHFLHIVFSLQNGFDVNKYPSSCHQESVGVPLSGWTLV